MYQLDKKKKRLYRWVKNPTYNVIHQWLRFFYGRATKCEGENCSKKSKKYQYALIKNMKYERKRENFIILCVSCHRKYDMNERWKNKIIKNFERMRRTIKPCEICKRKIIVTSGSKKYCDDCFYQKWHKYRVATPA